MGSFSILHLILVLVIVLVFFGPSRLPSLGKSLGEAIRGFKKGLDGDEIDVTRRHDNLTAGPQHTQVPPVTPPMGTPTDNKPGGQS